MHVIAPRFTATFALYVTLSMLAGILPMSAENAQAGHSPAHELTTDRSAYFGFEDWVAIRVVDPTRDSDANTRTITVNATATGGSAVPVTLYETLEADGDDAVGVFVGSLGFSESSGGVGVMTVSSSVNDLSISLVHDPGAPGGGDATTPVVVTWKRTFDAQMSLGKGGLFNRYVGRDGTVQVNVTDLDHKGKGGLFVGVRPQGRADVPLLELGEECIGLATGSLATPCPVGTGTGKFFGNFSLRPTGDTSLEVKDRYLGTGNNVRTAFSLGNPVASVQTVRGMNLLAPHLGGSTVALATPAHYTFTSAGSLTLTSAGRTALGTRDLVINYTLPSTVGIVQVRVDDPATSTNEADPNFGPDLVDRVHRESFTVHYNDVRDKTGQPVLRSVSGEWLESRAATFLFLAEDLVSPLPVSGGVMHLFGAQAKLGLRVVDEDANANKGAVEQVEVRVTSFTTVNPTSDSLTALEEESIVLVETGPNTGEFQATLPVETVRVVNNDRLQVSTTVGLFTVVKGSYAESRAAGGAASGVAAAAFNPAAVTLTKSERAAFAPTGTGAVQILRVSTGAAATEFFGLGANLARVRITDSDITDCAQLSAGGTNRVRIRSAASPFVTELTFVSTDRVGNSCERAFGFETLSDDNLGEPDGLLGVSDGGTLAVEYTDPTNAVGQLNQIVTQSAVWRQAFDASVTFGGRFFVTSEDVPLVVQDPDLTVPEVFVTVTSLQDPGGVTYRLARDTSSPVPGTYRGVARFEQLATASPGNDRVAVANEGEVQAFYVDPRRADGTVDFPLPAKKATLLYPGSGAAEILAENLFLDVPVGVRIKDGNAGSNQNPIVANISTSNPALGAGAAQVRDVGETVQVGLLPGVTTANLALDFEGRRYAQVAKGNGNPNQQILIERFPVKPGTVQVFVNGAQWPERPTNFGATPDPGNLNPCASPRFCDKGFNFTLDRTFGRINFGQEDDPGAIPGTGSEIVVLYEPFEYYNETHLLTFEPRNSQAAGLRLKNAFSLVGATAVQADGTPGGGLFVDCIDDPTTTGGSENEAVNCFTARRKTLRGEPVFDVFVDGVLFRWCPTSDVSGNTAPCRSTANPPDPLQVFRPQARTFTIPVPSDPVIYLGSPAGSGSTVSIVYRGYDRVGGQGDVLSMVGVAPAPEAGTCQVTKILGGGAEQLLLRWVAPAEYAVSGSEIVFRNRAGGPGPDLVTFGNVVKAYPRSGVVTFGSDGNVILSDGTRVYRDTDQTLTGGLIQFTLSGQPRLCNADVTAVGVGAAGSGGDRIEINAVRQDPITGAVSTIPTKNNIFACVWLNDTRLYTRGLVTIQPGACGQTGAGLDENTFFQAQYKPASTLPEFIPSVACTPTLLGAPPAQGDGSEVCRGFDEVANKLFLVRKPLVPGSLSIRYCPPAAVCGPALGPTDLVVNPRTGAITLVSIAMQNSRIGDQFRFTGQLITDWNREVLAAAGDTLKVTYFDAANNGNTPRQITYTLPGVGGSLSTRQQGVVTFVDSSGGAKEEFFGLNDYANLTIVDRDRNRDPSVVETLTVLVEARAISRTGTAALPTFSRTITLFEQGTNSDTFRARLKFGPLAGPAPVGLTVMNLDLAKGNQFSVVASYKDTDQPAVGASFRDTIQKTVHFRPATRGAVTLEPATQVGVGSPLTVRVVDADRNGRLLQERLGRATGVAGQKMFLSFKPMLQDSQTLYVETGSLTGVFEVWEQVPNIAIGMGTRKVYLFNHLTGEIEFGGCVVTPQGTCQSANTNGAVPPTGAEVRADYFQSTATLNSAFVRLESYLLDPVAGFDLARDARPFATACNVAANPRCYDRLDLAVNELSGLPGQFQANVPFAQAAEPTCAATPTLPCPNAAQLATELEVPNPTDGVDRAVIVATYFDASYFELFRQRLGYTNPPPACADLDGAGPVFDGRPGPPFQQLMPGQATFPGVAGTPDPDCQATYGPREIVQAVTQFSEATTGSLTVSSRNMLLADGSVDPAAGFTAAQKIVYGTGRLDVMAEDADVNQDRAVANTGKVTLKTETNPTGAEFTLTERDGDDTRFVGKASLGPGGSVAASPRDQYVVAYTDLRNAQGVQSTIQKPDTLADAQNYRWFPAGTGSASVNRRAFIDTVGGGPLETPTVRIVDPDRNTLPTQAEQLRVRLSSVNVLNDDVNDATQAGRLYGLLGSCAASAPASPLTPQLTETGPNTGIFEGPAALVGSGAHLNPADGDTVLVTYCDPHDAEGREGPLAACPVGVAPSGLCRVGSARAATTRWYERPHGQVFFDKPRYVERSEIMTVTVVDKHDNGFTGGVDKVPVVLRAGSLAVKVDLIETGATTGEFQARIGLQATDTDGIADINVPDNVVIRAIYTDVTTKDGLDPSGLPGASVAETVFAKDTLPPVTTLKVESQVPPVSFKGETWFRSPPSITLTAKDDLSEVARIEYRWDATGSFTTYTGPFAPPSQGRHVLRYRAVDAVGNVEAGKNTTVNWDETPPSAAVTNLNASKAPGGIRLTWTSPVDVNNPLEFAAFHLYRDVTTSSSTQTTNLSAVVTAPDEQEHTYYVRVVDAAGNLGPLSAGLKAVADITPPVLSNATVLPGLEFEVGTVTKIDLSVRVLPTPGDVVAKVEATVAVPGAATETLALLDPNADNVYTGSFANLTVTGAYAVTFRALDAVGNAATAQFTVNVKGKDTTAPTITFVDGTVVPRGQSLLVTVRDNIGISKVFVSLDGGPEREVTYASESQVAVVDTTALGEGAHRAVMRAVDTSGNSVTRTLNFIVGPALPLGVPPPPLDVRSIATAAGKVTLRWKVVPSADLDHYEVWREASPAVKIADIDPDTCFGGECTYEDTTAQAGTNYRYCILGVSANGTSAGLDHPSTPCMAVRTAGTVAGAGENFLERFWWVFLLAAAIVVGVAVFLVQREERQKRVKAKQTLEHVPNGPGERHHLKCPACETRFTVTGTKPIVTNCPHCGKKGILR